MLKRCSAGVLLAGLVFAGTLAAADWPNSGGNAARNCLTTELGPDANDLLWSGGRSSLIAWQPVIEGDRVFVVRQTGFPPGGEPNGSPLVCMDLNDGHEIWAVNIPFQTGDWTTWVGGVKNGRVFASRSGNGASVWQKLYCLDAVTGNVLWISQDMQNAGAYDGVVFADNGDPIVGSFMDIWRFNALTGATVWHATHTGSVSGSCGVAVYGNGVYIVDAVAGGNVIKKFDIATGAYLYQSPVMTGFLTQQTPFVGPDGTVYFQRVQNNPATDFFYAFRDTGTAFVEKWNVPAAYCVTGEYGVGPDGSVYMIAPGPELTRRDPNTGALLNTSGVLAGFSKPRMVIDRDGRVFFSNGAFGSGQLYAFNADLTVRWTTPVTNINIGGPALAAKGTLVVCGVGTDVRAYRTPRQVLGDMDCSGKVDFFDINPFVLGLSDPAGYAAMYPNCNILNGDINQDGKFDFFDINPFVALLSS